MTSGTTARVESADYEHRSRAISARGFFCFRPDSYDGVTSIGRRSLRLNRQPTAIAPEFPPQMRSVLQHADYAAQNAALLARSLGTAFQPKKGKEGEAWGAGFGSFHEKITLPEGLIDGSGHQLWSDGAVLNVCIRAGLVK